MGFERPLFLLLLPLVLAPLILRLYRERARVLLPVTAPFLLHHIKRAPAADEQKTSRRLRWRDLWHALVILLLVLATSAPLLGGGGQVLMVVVDASRPMAATDGDQPVPGSTRLEEALIGVEEVIRKTKPHRVGIVRAMPGLQPQVVIPPAYPPQAVQLLESGAAITGPGNLGEGELAEAAILARSLLPRTEEGDALGQVVVVTSKPPPVENQGISFATFQHNPLRLHAGDFRVRVFNNSTNPWRGYVELKSEGRLLSPPVEAKLAARGERVLTIPYRGEGAKGVEIKIDHNPEEAGGQRGDQYPEDDRFFVVIPYLGKVQVDTLPWEDRLSSRALKANRRVHLPNPEEEGRRRRPAQGVGDPEGRTLEIIPWTSAAQAEATMGRSGEEGRDEQRASFTITPLEQGEGETLRQLLTRPLRLLLGPLMIPAQMAHSAVGSPGQFSQIYPGAGPSRHWELPGVMSVVQGGVLTATPVGSIPKMAENIIVDADRPGSSILWLHPAAASYPRSEFAGVIAFDPSARFGDDYRLALFWKDILDILLFAPHAGCLDYDSAAAQGLFLPDGNRQQFNPEPGMYQVRRNGLQACVVRQPALFETSLDEEMGVGPFLQDLPGIQTLDSLSSVMGENSPGRPLARALTLLATAMILFEVLFVIWLRRSARLPMACEGSPQP